MALVVVAADHVGLGLDVLAALSGGVKQIGPAVVRSVHHVRGVVVLATCNRV